MKSITIAPKIPTDPMTIQTHPFFAEHLICQCLTVAMDWVGMGKNIEIGMENTPDDVRIHIFPLYIAKQSDNGSFPDKETQMLANAIRARVEQNEASNTLSLIFPRSIPSPGCNPGT